VVGTPGVTTVAVMQPYFIPYAGYFRLFAQSDVFVIYDCVQFPRRGWVHRNRLFDREGNEDWLTLPLARASMDVTIGDLRFADDAGRRFQEQLRRFPDATSLPPAASELSEALLRLEGTPVDYIEALLEATVRYLDLAWNVVRSSSMQLAESLRGQERILEIVRRLGGEAYVNAPGGRELYDAAAFEAAGVELRFLEPYAGPSHSILTRIARERREDLSKDVSIGRIIT
jgi:hypothetical protein